MTEMDDQREDSTVSSVHSQLYENGPCRVCTDKSDGAHFGVDSCRACAAFFRRSVVLGKKYVCRQGGNNCRINKNVRCMCRKCRYVKCLSAGMLPENVHQRSTTLSHIHPSSSRTQEIESPLFIRPLYSNIEDEYPLLTKIHHNYTQMTQLRQSSELTLFPSACLRKIFGGANGDLSPCNFNLLNKIMKAAVPIIADFCNMTFPSFDAFGQDDKWTVFRNFIGVLFHFECGYRTASNLHHDNTKRQITVTTYLDILQYDKFFTESEPPVNAQPQLIKLIKDRSEGALAMRLSSTFKRLNLTGMEIAAFVGLTLWSPNIDKINEEMHEICTREREAIFQDLHKYYKYGQSRDEYAVRLGEFMSLFSNLQACTQKMREEMELFSLFDIFEKESFVYHLLK